MSASELYIGEDADGQFVVVDLSKAATWELFERIRDGMAAIVPEYIPQFEGEAAGGVMSIADLPSAAFMDASRTIIQACDEVAVLQPFKAELKTALEADPRFKKAAA